MTNPIVDMARGAWLKIIGVWRMVFNMSELLFDTMYAAVRKGRTPNLSLASQINRQILYTGVEAFALIGAIALLCGSAIVLVAWQYMPALGLGEKFGEILIIAIVNELAPFVTALVVVGRSGSALAAYIGTMRVSREVDALEMMGIDPIQFLVQPALVGIVVSVICLNVYFIAVSIIGGLLVATYVTETPFEILFEKIIMDMQFRNVFFNLVKSVSFGFVVALMSSWHGLNVRNVRMVPIAALNAVVGSMFFTIVLNVLLSIGFYTF